MNDTEPNSDTISIGWDEIERDAVQLSSLLAASGRWEGIVAVARGGLVPAGIVAYGLRIQNIEIMSISSYDGRNRSEPKILKAPSIPNDGNKWLVVEDLVDTGTTMRLARELLPRSHIAVLYAKPLGQKFADTYVRAFPQESWLNFPWDREFQPF